MSQDLVNIGLGIIVSGCGWWLKTVWDSHRELEKKVSGIETLVAGQYVKREELTAAINKIENSLDRNFQLVFQKLDHKQDK
jgi:hypothetical protein